MSRGPGSTRRPPGRTCVFRTARGGRKAPIQRPCSRSRDRDEVRPRMPLSPDRPKGRPVIITDKPTEGAHCTGRPFIALVGSPCRDACRDGCGCLDRLLVEVTGRNSGRGRNSRSPPAGSSPGRGLDVHEPAQRPQACVQICRRARAEPVTMSACESRALS